MARRNDDLLDRLMRSLSFRGIVFHPATLFVLATLFLIGGAIFLWERHQDKIVNHDEFRLTEDKIHLTQPPEWAKDNLRQFVLSEAAGVDGNDEVTSASILDTQLVSRTAAAMKKVGYVERVDSIRKSRSGLDIDVVYRAPVALVELSQHTFPFKWPKGKGSKQILLPVDRLGVVMPQKLGKGLYLPKILIVHPLKSPARSLELPTWTDWPDERVKDAAAIGALFETTAYPMGISRIVTQRKPDQSNDGKIAFELWPDLGTQVIWGNAPGKEIEGEAKAEIKLKALEMFMVKFGALNKLAPKRIDVRSGAVVFSAKTASNEPGLFVEVK